MLVSSSHSICGDRVVVEGAAECMVAVDKVDFSVDVDSSSLVHTTFKRC